MKMKEKEEMKMHKKKRKVVKGKIQTKRIESSFSG